MGDMDKCQRAVCFTAGDSPHEPPMMNARWLTPSTDSFCIRAASSGDASGLPSMHNATGYAPAVFLSAPKSLK